MKSKKPHYGSAPRIRSAYGLCLLTDQLCYINIPKCASTSMKYAISKMPGFRETNFIAEPEVLRNRKVVTVLRDPMSRFLSAYYQYVVKRQIEQIHTRTPLDLVINRLSTYDNVHFFTQSWFLRGTHPNMVGRVEDLNTFTSKLGIGPLLHLNTKENRTPLPQHPTFVPDYPIIDINDDLIYQIKSFYKEDYKLIERYFGN